MKNRRRPRSITDRGEEERDEGTDDDLLNGRTQPTEAGRGNHHNFRTKKECTLPFVRHPQIARASEKRRQNRPGAVYKWEVGESFKKHTDTCNFAIRPWTGQGTWHRAAEILYRMYFFLSFMVMMKA